MERAIEIYVVVILATLGLSHAVRPRVWCEFFEKLVAWGEAGALANGLLSLASGAIIVAFHNVWQGVPIVVTLLGWAFVAKAGVVLVFPAVGLRSMQLVSPENPRKIAAAGVVMLCLAAVLAAHLLTA